MTAWMHGGARWSAMTRSGALNLGTGTGTSIRDMIAELLDVAGAPDHPVTETGERTPGDQEALWADTTRVRDVLGWGPRTPLGRASTPC